MHRAKHLALVVVAALLPLLLAGLAHGRQTLGDYEDVRGMPDTPAGARVTELLEAINSGRPDRVEAFLRSAFEPEFLAAFPMAEHLGMFAEVHRQSRGYDFHSLRRYDPPLPETQVVAIVRNRLTEAWEGLILELEPDPPHRITGLSFGGARPPSDLEPEAPLTDAEIAARLEQFARRLAEAEAFSGAILLARHGEVLFEGAYGPASRRFDVPNRVDTRFNLGSMNKMFTAVAVAQLAEAGALSFDDSLAEHLGTDWLPPEVAEPIRISHLLNHTSGLGSYFNEAFFNSSRERFRAVDDYRPLVAGESPAFEPGTGERYSNTGFLLLGAVIEKASGRDYFEYVREHVYGPAGMTGSDSYEMDVPVENLAIGYSRETDPDGATAWRNNLFKHVIKGGPAGGGFSTVGDLLRFDRAMRSGRLVSAETAELLWTPKPGSPGYGYGFGIETVGGERVVGHGGGFPGISGQLDMYLDSGYTVAVLSNLDGGARVVSGRIRQWLSRREPGSDAGG